jgi:hypothetical protein
MVEKDYFVLVFADFGKTSTRFRSLLAKAFGIYYSLKGNATAATL